VIANTINKSKKLPYVIDLFSGCGGLALGFARAGFPILASVDMNAAATRTAQYNLHSGTSGTYPTKSLTGDIRDLSPKDLIPKSFDADLIVIGGPPCQAYSMAGRGKLRSLGEHRIHTNDLRGNLYIDFLDFAIEANASAIVMENVPASINYGEQNIPELACQKLIDQGYEANWTILNAADFGVPQRRERMFLIATHKNSGLRPVIPQPGFKSLNGEQTQIGKTLCRLLRESDHFASPSTNTANQPWVTVGDAISDLPRLFPFPNASYHLAKPSEAKVYSEASKNDFQQTMRGNKRASSGHAFRRTLRDFPIFEKMRPGDDYRNASKIAETLFQEKLKTSGTRIESNPERYNLLRKQTVPPYSLEKFYDKWKKLHPDKVSHTVPAHLGTDTYSHIHPWEPRGISVREAARLQSFPDSFVFPVNMGDAFKQIGNAVPPLLAEAIAISLRNEIRSIK
jgi:DNA (cytosine-5)-methyltransferase 1